MKKTSSSTTELIKKFISTANKYLGYQSELLGRNIFGERVGYISAPWAGAFIDVVARESGLQLPSFTYTPAALAEFIRQGNVSRVPQAGDIAIFNFASSTASAFSSPHVGIVTDTRHVNTTGIFLTVEGNVIGTGPYKQFDGVHTKSRHLTDVILFLRPAEFRSKATGTFVQLLIKIGKKLTGAAPDLIELEQIQEAARTKETVGLRALRTNTRNKQIELVQLALSQVTDIKEVERGKWDGPTAAAFSRFRRNIGVVGAAANATDPDLPTLKRLAAETGLFQVPRD
jgi:hypothetical protein